MALNLDSRQRAMLREMGVPVWWPAATEVAAPDATARPAAVESVAPVANSAARTAPTAPAAPIVARRDQATPHAAVPPATQQVVPRVVPADATSDADWPRLRQQVMACEACGLCQGRRAPVFPSVAGPVQADWLVVGEPPDETEERSNTPFAGPAGQLLDNMLRAVRRSRDGQGQAGAHLTNVVKCRPAPVRNPEPAELAQCASLYLRREVALVRPRVILAMGRFAARSLLAESGDEVLAQPFGRLRGQVFRFQGVPVVVTYHPARLLRSPQDKARAWADLCLAQQLSRDAG